MLTLSRKVLILNLILISFIFGTVISNKGEERNFSQLLIDNVKAQFMNSIMKVLKPKLEMTSFENLKFLDSETKTLNVSDFTLNTALFMVHRGVPLTITSYNNTENQLPIAIDSQSLKILVDELGKIDPNRNMSLRIYEDPSIHQVPKIITDIDGNSLNLQIGMEFGVFYDSAQTNPTIVLDMDITVLIKMGYDISSQKKLSIHFPLIKVKDINIKSDTLSVDKDLLFISLTNFFKIAVDGVKDMTSNIDVLTLLQNLTTATYTGYDIVPKFGYTLFMLNN